MGLVLCPNTALCHQVVRLVSSLQGPSGQPLLSACHVSSSSPPPFDSPDVVVTTPGALKTLFDDRGAMYGSAWTAEVVALRSAWIVVDEADLLWQGGYVKDLTRLLDVSGRAASTGPHTSGRPWQSSDRAEVTLLCGHTTYVSLMVFLAKSRGLHPNVALLSGPGCS